MRPTIPGRDELYNLIGRSAHYADERETATLLHYHMEIKRHLEGIVEAKRKCKFLVWKLKKRSGEVE